MLAYNKDNGPRSAPTNKRALVPRQQPVRTAPHPFFSNVNYSIIPFTN